MPNPDGNRPNETPSTANNDTSANDSSTTDFTQLKLFSVVFQEAALDSPSFRAMTNYVDTQLDHTEKWISAMAAMLKKIPPQVRELESNLMEFLEHLVPLVLQDAFGFLDDEYVYAELHNTKSVLHKFWTLAVEMVHVSVPETEKLKNTITMRVSEYQQQRQRFLRAQETYDLFLTTFMATPKTKDAVNIREDLATLFTVRKAYISAAMELLSHMVQLSDHIAADVSYFNSSVWKLKMSTIKENPVALGLFRDLWTLILRVAAYHDHCNRTAGTWRKELQRAGRYMEEATLARHAPSPNKVDYELLAINLHTLRDPNETAINKHGYVFMKAWSERSSKPIWVKRWAFVQGGVFGMLVMNQAGTSVEETDKIGVLLCSTRYTAAEERRFCFELKTISTTVVLQVETLAQLRLWLTVFDNARKRIASPQDPAHELMKIASGRYPPLVEEFLASSPIDRELTSPYVVTSDKDMITPSSLSAHLELNDRLFRRHIYGVVPHITLPIATAVSAQLLLAYSLTGEIAVPTALTANVWGSLNWGVHHLNDLHRDHVFEPIPPADDTRTLGDGITLPQNYPNRWLAKDIQMRALFESALDSDECCLVLFPGLILANTVHELRGMVVVTQHHLYTYVNTVGFVSLSKTPVDWFAEAQCVTKENFDVVKIVHMGGIVRVKTFLADGTVVSAMLNCIFSNQALDLPVGVTRLIHKLVEIESAGRARDREAIKVEKGKKEDAEHDAALSFELTLGCKWKPSSSLGPSAESVSTVASTTSVSAVSALSAPSSDSVTSSESSSVSVSTLAGTNVAGPRTASPRSPAMTTTTAGTESESRGPVSQFNGKSIASGKSALVSKPASHSSLASFSDPSGFPDLLPHTRYTGHHDVDVPPQALFHMLFGAKSSLLEEACPFHNNRVGAMPHWTPTSSGRLRRQCFNTFLFYNGASVRAAITHEMECCVVNEYYCVRLIFGPFQFSYGPPFVLANRIVIQALGAGRARLKYFVAVRLDSAWVLGPVLRSLCQTMDAVFFRRLARLVDAGVARLGNDAKVNKSVYHYGKLQVLLPLEPEKKAKSELKNSSNGAKKDASQPTRFTSSSLSDDVGSVPPAHIDSRVFAHLLFQSFMVWALLRIFWCAAGVGRAVRAAVAPFTAHRVLWALIAVLAVSNSYLAARNSAHYWNARAASSVVRDALNYEPMMLEKAIYLKDMHTVVERAAVLGPQSLCVQQFRNQSFVVNYNRPQAWASYSSARERGVAERLKLTLQDIGIRRNQLVVSLRMLKDLEEAVAFGEWHNWLVSELAKCETVLGADVEEDDAMASLREYCGACSVELEAIGERME